MFVYAVILAKALISGVCCAFGNVKFTENHVPFGDCCPDGALCRVDSGKSTLISGSLASMR